MLCVFKGREGHAGTGCTAAALGLELQRSVARRLANEILYGSFRVDADIAGVSGGTKDRAFGVIGSSFERWNMAAPKRAIEYGVRKGL